MINEKKLKKELQKRFDAFVRKCGMSGKDIREKRQKSSRLFEMPGQISISDILNVPESGTRR